jgi:hypothetical protein
MKDMPPSIIALSANMFKIIQNFMFAVTPSGSCHPLFSGVLAGFIRKRIVACLCVFDSLPWYVFTLFGEHVYWQLRYYWASTHFVRLFCAVCGTSTWVVNLSAVPRLMRQTKPVQFLPPPTLTLRRPKSTFKYVTSLGCLRLSDCSFQITFGSSFRREQSRIFFFISGLREI